jgi:hypothetical protein
MLMRDALRVHVASFLFGGCTAAGAPAAVGTSQLRGSTAAAGFGLCVQDLDCFFVQVEQLRRPALRHLAMAVQQHQDIIAVNYPARDAGVTKHMDPAAARVLLKRVGGQVDPALLGFGCTERRTARRTL